MIELGSEAGFSNGFQEADRAQAGNFSRIFRNVEADSNVTLGAEVVDFVRLNGSQNAVE